MFMGTLDQAVKATRDKYSSLFFPFVSYEEKCFITLGRGCEREHHNSRILQSVFQLYQKTQPLLRIVPHQGPLL